MSRERYTPEQIIKKLREAEEALSALYRGFKAPIRCLALQKI
jgi:hypothetical protein